MQLMQGNRCNESRANKYSECSKIIAVQLMDWIQSDNVCNSIYIQFWIHCIDVYYDKYLNKCNAIFNITPKLGQIVQ